jgi:hypothetical protein
MNMRDGNTDIGTSRTTSGIPGCVIDSSCRLSTIHPFRSRTTCSTTLGAVKVSASPLLSCTMVHFVERLT